MADLKSELIGDFGLVAGAFRVERFEGIAGSHREEAAGAQEADEGAERQRLLRPQVGEPGGVAGRLAPGCPHQQPVVAVGHQPERDVGRMAQFGHAAGGGGFPPPVGQRLAEVSAGRVDGDQEARPAWFGVARRVQQDEVGSEHFAVFQLAGFESGRDGLALGEHLVRMA